MNDDKSKKKLENRQSRFVWSEGDIVIIKSGDQGEGEKVAPASPEPAAPKPSEDDDQQKG